MPAADPATAPAPGTDPAAPSTAAPAVFAAVRRPRRWVYLLTSVALTVLLTGIAGLYAVQSLLYTPERVVTGYLSALSEKDTTAARSFREEPRSESPNDLGELPMIPMIPMTASYQPSSEVVVTSIEELNEDRTHREKLYLHRQERKERGVFRGWLIYGGINRLTGQATVVDGKVTFRSD